MEPINFNKTRKARAKAQAKLDAAANRARHGRTKAEQTTERMAAERAERTLDGAKIERPRPPTSDD